jgi:hypothetical protein
MKQVTFCWQLGSLPHAVSWLQQLSAMQSPHALPVVGQMTGGPHTPALHCPLQHCASELHVPPSCLQAHCPFVHFFEQHCTLALHIPPSGVHCGGPQTPPLH